MRLRATVRKYAPDEAGALVRGNPFLEQRRVNRNHVQFFRQVIEAGQLDTGAPIRFAMLGSTRYLLDGQHRLLAISMFPPNFSISLAEVTTECATMIEVGALYARIDRGLGRSVYDALRALGMYDMDAFGKAQMSAVMACAPLFAAELRPAPISGYAYASKSAEGRAIIMAPWMVPAQRYFEAVSPGAFGSLRHLMRREVLAVGIATFGDLPAATRAHEFWRGMATDDGLAQVDPRKQLLEFLRAQGSQLGRHSKGIGMTAHVAALAWGAWMDNKQLRALKVRDVKDPLRIRGTRFEKRQEEGGLLAALGPPALPPKGDAARPA